VVTQEQAKHFKFTDAALKKFPVPGGNDITLWDTAVDGLGMRITRNESRAFLIDYYTRAGKRRRYTIGPFPNWSVRGAREEARKLLRLIDVGGDPLGELQTERAAPDMGDLIKRFEEEHVDGKRPHTQYDYKNAIKNHIRPALGRMKVAEVAFEHVNALHRKLTRAGKTTQANRVVAIASKMFSLAVKWKLRTDNPCKSIERNGEHERKRYLSRNERRRLMKVIETCEDRQVVEIILLCLFTGCRVGEAMAACWNDIDLTEGTWTKPGSTTKQKTTHVTPLSAATVELLRRLRARTNGVWVFPSPDSKTGHRVTIAKRWKEICKAAGIVPGRKGLQIHDLRHSFASHLRSTGHSLELIGELLGHSNPITTKRYAHLYDEPLRAAVEKIAELIGGNGNR